MAVLIQTRLPSLPETWMTPHRHWRKHVMLFRCRVYTSERTAAVGFHCTSSGRNFSPFETRLQGLGTVTKASIDKVATRKLEKLGWTTPLSSIKCARVFPVSQQEREQGILDRIAAALLLAIRFQTQKNNSNVKFLNNCLGLFRGKKKKSVDLSDLFTTFRITFNNTQTAALRY